MKILLSLTLGLSLLLSFGTSPTYAAASKKCIVSGEAIGGDSGDPVEVTAPDGRKVLLCCKSCAKKFKANPGKYMAELDKKK